MREDLKKKVILITGCSSGLGNLTAIKLARQGDTIYASMRDSFDKNKHARKELENVAEKENLNLSVIDLDVTNENSIKKAINEIIEKSKKIDVLINNAGIMSHGVTEAFELNQIKNEFEVNVFGSFLMSKAVLPYMRNEKSGLIIQFSSLAGRFVFPFAGVYCATKFAAEALAESFSYELKSFGIDSVIIEPGNYSSNLIANSPAPQNEETINAYGELGSIGAQTLSSLNELNNGESAANPMEVVDTISNLINLKKGERPLRSVIKGGMDIGTENLNKINSDFQNKMLRDMGYIAV